MSSRFTPCPACARHVKEGEGTCPFCGVNAPAVSRPSATASRAAVGRLSRSALFAASAVGVALATTDCGSSSQPAYGGSVPVGDAASASSSGGSADGSSTTPGDATGEAAPSEGGSAQPLYGAVVPPVDAGSGGRFEGGAMALYGAAPVGTHS